MNDWPTALTILFLLASTIINSITLILLRKRTGFLEDAMVRHLEGEIRFHQRER